MKAIIYMWNKISFPIRLKIKDMLGKSQKKMQVYSGKIANIKEIRTIIPYSDKKVIQKAFFLKEIEKTEKLINRNLDIWKH